MTESIGHKYNAAIRAMHLVHGITVIILIVTGLRIYLDWGFPSTFSEARGLHMAAAIAFLAASWILLPYGMLLEIFEKARYARTKCNFKDFRGIWLFLLFNARYCKTEGIRRFLRSSIFNRQDLKTVKEIVLSYMGKGDYPAYAIYNERSGLYENRIHPVMKLFIPLESTAILFIALTGIALYDINWTIISINAGGLIMRLAAGTGAIFGLNAMVLVRTLHLACSYFFILELIIHVGILQLDLKTKEAWKAIFISGKEDIHKSPYTAIKK